GSVGGNGGGQCKAGDIWIRKYWPVADVYEVWLGCCQKDVWAILVANQEMIVVIARLNSLLTSTTDGAVGVEVYKGLVNCQHFLKLEGGEFVYGDKLLALDKEVRGVKLCELNVHVGQIEHPEGATICHFESFRVPRSENVFNVLGREVDHRVLTAETLQAFE
ncbi:hypothetical protein BDK51DRAFT_25942, partial [Blyttiomyces helicus]